MLTLFGPGAGRGAAYILVQMFLLAIVSWFCGATPLEQRNLMAACGYICFFTGAPVVLFWWFAPAKVTSFRLRVAVLCVVAAALVVPDVINYVIYQPETLDIRFSFRHLINPFMTLDQWDKVEQYGWAPVPFTLGLVGLLAYAELARQGWRTTARAMRLEPAAVPVGGETGRGGILD